MKILVVDDDATIRELAEELLTSAGYNVLTARDGEEALRLAYDEHPDLILLDLLLPKMTGFHVLQEIRKNPRFRNTPILILSVLVSGIDTDASIHELDVAGFIDKGEFVTSLIPCVKEILSKQAHDVVKSTSRADSVDKAERKKILVADGNVRVRTFAANLLRAANCDVLEASDGAQAICLIKEKHPDMILLNLLLPPMTGYDVVKETQKDERTKDTPILLMSEAASEKEVLGTLSTSAIVGFLDKRQIKDTLVSRVQEILYKPTHRVA